MKLLIAYDGSGCAEAAIDDLYQAGLPETGTAHVISVAEVWLPPPDSVNNESDAGPVSVENIVRVYREKGERILAEAATHVKLAEARLRTALPGWKITSSATYGSPAWEILGASEEHCSDLIVVGSHGRSALGRLFLGSISQRVLTEAHCSVRISRGKNQVDPIPARLLVGFDGSKGASLAVDAICARRWPDGTEVRVISVVDAIRASAITSFVPPIVRMVEDVNLVEEHWIEQLAEAEVAKLEKAGLETRYHLHEGNPKDILVKEAESWAADCIFVGATAFGSALGRVLLGSTSAAIAARAHCSVEVVRMRPAKKAGSNGTVLRKKKGERR